jgi:hypothetical protein
LHRGLVGAVGAVAAGAAAPIWVPATASAAALEITATTGPQSQAFLAYYANRGERNRVTVSARERGITVSDPGAGRIRILFGTQDCHVRRGGRRVFCAVGPGLPVDANLGDRDDSIRFRGQSATPVGPTARTEARSADALADVYEDTSEGQFDQQTGISGGKGDDRLIGTGGKDVIAPGPGRDRVDAGGGRDFVLDTPDRAPDTLLGGRGIDTFDVDGTRPVTIDLALDEARAGRETDSLDSFERARGGRGDDTLMGTGSRDGLFGDTGSDTVLGRGGDDYLGGDLPQVFSVGTTGQDTLVGGTGDDLLDGRDAGSAKVTPADRLFCGDGADRILGRQDDLVEPACEFSAFGSFNEDLDLQSADLEALSEVQPVARGADGSPTYRIACPGEYPCEGRVRLERPPVARRNRAPEVFGSATFSIPGGEKGDVAVMLNDSGRIALAQPGALASVRVTSTSHSRTNFGWQQQLGPSP